MSTPLLVLILLLCFAGLAKAADLAVAHVRGLGKKLGLSSFALGILLGFFTSAPELFIGINSTIRGISGVSFGNLMGGIVVLFTLVAGVSAVFHRDIDTTHAVSGWRFLPIGLFFLAPLLFMRDGIIREWEGVILILLYGAVLYYLSRLDERQLFHVELESGEESERNIGVAVGALVAVMGLAAIIVRVSAILLAQFGISPFLAGVVLFALGTNLPELMVSLQAARKHAASLSLGNLTGSAAANVLIVGALSLLKPMTVMSVPLLIPITVSLVTIIIAFALLARSDGRLTRQEGVLLVTLYLITLFGEIAMH